MFACLFQKRCDAKHGPKNAGEKIAAQSPDINVRCPHRTQIESRFLKLERGRKSHIGQRIPSYALMNPILDFFNESSQLSQFTRLRVHLNPAQ
jgi:hypothetical protein